MILSWCEYGDSNSGPLAWEASALTTELHSHVGLLYYIFDLISFAQDAAFSSSPGNSGPSLPLT